METFTIDDLLLIYLGTGKDDQAIELFIKYTGRTIVEARGYVHKYKILARAEIKERLEIFNDLTATEKAGFNVELKELVNDEKFIRQLVKENTRIALLFHSYAMSQTSDVSETYLKSLNEIEPALFDLEKKKIRINETLNSESADQVKKRTTFVTEESEKLKSDYKICLVIAIVITLAYAWFYSVMAEQNTLLYSAEERKVLQFIISWTPVLILGLFIGAIYFHDKWKKLVN